MNLTPEEIRVLGSLVEKEATTPDAYPLSTNSLVAACNQRTSRDPVLDLAESTVTETLISLRERGLVRTARGEGSRVYKHAHTLGAALELDPGSLAVLSVLMLRGPQTVGELRTRTERQIEFASLDAVQFALEQLGRREPPLAVILPRRPGQKEARWEHALGGRSDEPATAPPSRSGAADPPEASVETAELRAEVADLRRRLDALEETVRAELGPRPSRPLSP